LLVYGGNFDKLKPLLPNGQSPLTSYYLVFKNSSGQTIFPSVPVNLIVNDKSAGTQTYYYPINSSGTFDTAKEETWKNPVATNVDLPVMDPAFVFAVSKNQITNSNVTVNQNNAKTTNSLLTTIAALIVVIFAISVIFWVIWNKKK